MTELATFLAGQLEDAEVQWSLGTFGAIAEFVRDADEPVALSRGETNLAAVTDRGGIRLALHPAIRPFAFETATKTSWSQRIALCLPQHDCAMSGRTVLTELGPDTDALRERERGAVLFDLGLGALQADCCVRIDDPAIAARLRAQCGRPVFEGAAMELILATQPHRVFVSRIGRIEVFQPIPPPDGRSPEGPHTHVLPDLLRSRRTHAATEPIPRGLVPCAHLYPPHPAQDGMGRPHPFDRRRHDAFQALLGRYGDPDFVALKQQVHAAIGGGGRPDSIGTDRRFARTTIRVALRQLRAQDEAPPALASWLAAHERAGTSADDPYHHEAVSP